ncbi:hypothetical protein N7481_008261 [Penicillium waksmanii]|uniref:uncharacterized protein n=1 Tax=Penicillium waksmanii TaxID=69791 RepID=UPI0025498281|nr:uncharacterized protein N7481_008261 [Penicillium waksmanii]KAJ5980963.1 hypothetical protein N7481_008261 [Penicillium waksmanii]
MAQKVFSNFLFHEKISCVEETPVRGRKPTEKPKPSSLRIYSLTGLEYLFGVEPDFLTTITRDEILFFRNDDTFLQRESVKERNADDESPLACVRCINDMQHGLSTLLSQTFLQELPFCGPDSSDEDFLREPFKETNHSKRDREGAVNEAGDRAGNKDGKAETESSDAKASQPAQ